MIFRHTFTFCFHGCCIIDRLRRVNIFTKATMTEKDAVNDGYAYVATQIVLSIAS